jgi:DNA-binding MarR family transcriptional regulator
MSKSKPTPRTSSSPHGTQGWLAVARAYNLCDAAIGARLAELGLRIGEHEVLANLATSPGMTQQELAARCFVAKSGVSMLLTQMEAKGWVVRQADGADARVWRLSLAAKGRALAARCIAIQSDVIRLMVEGAIIQEAAIVAIAFTLRNLRRAGSRDGESGRRRACSAASARSLHRRATLAST